MSLSDLLSLSGVPGLSAGVKILESTYIAIENVKLYRQQCKDMNARCLKLMVALRDSSQGLEGTKALEIADEIEAIIVHIQRKVREWSSWSQLKSFLQKNEIKDGIDRLQKDIDAAMMKFSIQMNMEVTRSQHEYRAIQERDKAEFREVLHIIVRNTDNLRALVSMKPSVDSRPVEEMMESLQTELMDPSLQPSEEEDFKAGLWMLHEETSKLPPLTDLTGQVTLSSQSTVAKGAFNDIYLGQWLDREPVALRLPRTLANNSEDQHRFQREVSIWRELQHSNIVPLYGVIYINQDLYSVSPWMDNGTAVDYVKKFPSVDRKKILIDAATGLEYLHRKGIVHGDLRGANVLISKDGTARLSDFGLSKFLEDCGKAKTTSDSLNPRWFAPELLESVPSTHSDVWSFGMVCLEILSGELPYSNISHNIAVLHKLAKGDLPDRPGRGATSQGLTDDMWDLMKKCWRQKPPSRPSISDVRTAILQTRDGQAVSRGWTRLIGRSDSMSSTAPSNPPTMSTTRSPTMSTIKPISSRPSTAASDMSTMSSISGRRPQMSIASHSGSQEDDELSPLGGVGSSRFAMEPTRRRQNSSSSSSSNLILTVDFEPSPILQSSPRSISRILDGPPRLEVPTPSSSLPAQHGTYFPSDRSFSYDRGVPSPMSIRSFGSSSHLSHFSDSVREAVSDSREIVNVVHGVVSTGTLEGLVLRLINNFNQRSDIEYREALLTACADFTTPEDLFAILSRRFNEAEEKHPEDRVALQYNIFIVIMYWLSHRYLQVDSQLLWQMKDFCESAINMKSSTTMVDKARDLLQLVENKKASLSPSIGLTPGRKLPQASQIKPSDLAVALTLLEGDKYKALHPSDYIAHLGRHTGYNNVKGACMTNNEIILWVKGSILHDDSVENRAGALKFFIHTAMECRKLRNFASLAAIATALHSAPIERLRLTRSQLTQQMQSKLDALAEIVNPSSNHRGYRQALNEVNNAEERGRCVPWLPVHLKELNVVLQRYPPTVQVDGHPLINFQRYLKFMERIKEVVHYKAPDLERYRQQGPLDYLENELRNLEKSNSSEERLIERSKTLEARETRDYQTRKQQLKTLGFRA